MNQENNTENKIVVSQKPKFRVQPQEFDAPADDPFKNDRLGREETVKILTNLIGSIEGPCVLSIDASWGMGKTSFIKMWAQYLRDFKRPVVEFNAWDSDYSGDPFIPLSAELTRAFKEYADSSLRHEIDKLMKESVKVLKILIQSIASHAIAAVPIAGPTLDKSIDDARTKYANERLSKFVDEKQALEQFRSTLEVIAKSLQETNENHEKYPLVVFIDELDRCRPTYAIELLEVAKHLFNVDGIVFVLPINRTQLANSLKGLYGNKFDGDSYLRRFIDLDFRLPEPQRDEFITALLERIQFADVGSVGRKLLQHFFRTSTLTIRQIEQATLRLGLVLVTLPNGGWPATAAAITLLILRTTNREIYYQFINKDASITDNYIIDAVFERLNLKRQSSDSDDVNIAALFESIIITGHQEKKIVFGEKIESELLDGYEVVAEIRDQDDPNVKYARNVVNYVGNIKNSCQNSIKYIEREGYGFQECIECLELLPSNLIDEPEVITAS